jgi:hypothetical protein
MIHRLGNQNAIKRIAVMQRKRQVSFRIGEGNWK